MLMSCGGFGWIHDLKQIIGEADMKNILNHYISWGLDTLHRQMMVELLTCHEKLNLQILW